MVYGTFVEKIFKPDNRETPAIRMKDGVDYVPMNKYKNALINLLNIAGTGPIYGPIQGILFGPIAFITIPIGCVISGAVHDYLCGMVSMRNDGAQMPKIIQKFLGDKIYRGYNLFLCFMLLVLGVVFTYTPADIIAYELIEVPHGSYLIWFIYGAILLYYLIATLFPIDKIIGKIYPIFGLILLLTTIGVFVGIFLKGYQLTELDFQQGLDGVFGLYPLYEASGNTGVGTHFFPIFFVTVACGITSGFHSTQCTLIGRTVQHEKEGKMTFYGMMILEGFIAMIWAAAAMGLYNSGSTVGATAMVGDVADDMLGEIGSIVALLGIVILPISSGDTSLRSCRLMLADYLHIDQKSYRKRIGLTLAMFVPVIIILVFAKLNEEGFNVLWQYFAWGNQVTAVFSLTAISIYLMAKKGASKFTYLISFLPGCFYFVVVVLFILSADKGLDVPDGISYIITGILFVIYVITIRKHGKKYAENHIED